MTGVVTRPQEGPPSFLCNRCDIVMFDGVHYQVCPRCGLLVDWVDLALPVWACPTCFRMVNGEAEVGPRCPKCERSMRRLSTSQSPQELGRPRPPAVQWSPGVVVVAAMALVIPAFSLSLHLEWRWLALGVAPLLVVVPVVISAGVLHVLADSIEELRDLVRDVRTRAVHGLEHATANLLSGQGHGVSGGLSCSWGFSLWLNRDLDVPGSPADAVRLAAEDAIRRVQRGEPALVLHNRCGTTWLTGITLAALASLTLAAIGLCATLTFSVWVVVAGSAVLLPALLTQPFGRFLQRVGTVESRFTAARITQVCRRELDEGVRYEVAVEITP